jgi:hypothetical protein
VNVLRAPEGFLIALTYGRESEWVKNILTAGGWQLETRHVRYQLSAPAIVHDPSRRRFPLLVRMIRGLIGAKFNKGRYVVSLVLIRITIIDQERISP